MKRVLLSFLSALICQLIGQVILLMAEDHRRGIIECRSQQLSFLLCLLLGWGWRMLSSWVQGGWLLARVLLKIKVYRLPINLIQKVRTSLKNLLKVNQSSQNITILPKKVRIWWTAISDQSVRVTSWLSKIDLKGSSRVKTELSKQNLYHLERHGTIKAKPHLCPWQDPLRVNKSVFKRQRSRKRFLRKSGKNYHRLISLANR